MWLQLSVSCRALRSLSPQNDSWKSICLKVPSTDRSPPNSSLMSKTQNTRELREGARRCAMNLRQSLVILYFYDLMFVTRNSPQPDEPRVSSVTGNIETTNLKALQTPDVPKSLQMNRNKAKTVLDQV